MTITQFSPRQHAASALGATRTTYRGEGSWRILREASLLAASRSAQQLLSGDDVDARAWAEAHSLLDARKNRI